MNTRAEEITDSDLCLDLRGNLRISRTLFGSILALGLLSVSFGCSSSPTPEPDSSSQQVSANKRRKERLQRWIADSKFEFDGSKTGILHSLSEYTRNA
jgi:hypothetical protein